MNRRHLEIFTHIDVSPTAGHMQLKRIVGAYSNAIVLVAVYSSHSLVICET